MTDPSEILRLATELRGALEKVDPSIWEDATISSFPRGACGHCAELLARYLRDRLGIDVTYTSGRIGHLVSCGKTHAWLEFDGLVIDISADQFGLPAVIVERRSPFHQHADDVDRYPIIQDHWWGRYGARLYEAALRVIAENSAN